MINHDRLLKSEERRRVMELTTSWKEEGRQEGRQEGRREGQARLVLRLLEHRFGKLPRARRERVRSLSATQLEALGESLLDFRSQSDLDIWLKR